MQQLQARRTDWVPPFLVSGSLRQFCLPADHLCLLCVLSYWREIKQDGGMMVEYFSFEQQKTPACVYPCGSLWLTISFKKLLIFHLFLQGKKESEE